MGAPSLAELVKLHRAAAGLSQEALAERAGLSARTIGDLETGFARSPRVVTLMLLAEALRLSDEDGRRLREAARKPGAPDETLSGHRLPAAPELFGRDAELAELRALFVRDDVRLVTLSGPAGVGKTSLALRLAHELAREFAGGAVFVELAATVEPARVVGAIAEALEIGEASGGSLHETVVKRLRGASMLLVLDNFEHLMPAASVLAELLAAAPRVRALVTSREALHLRAERLFPVRPLELPAAVHARDPASLRSIPSVALFVARAQALQPNFALTAKNGETVAAIVARLEGLPLAIELAAPRLGLLPPRALLARLERRLPILADGAVDLPARQQTMRNAIAWSYDLLEADEQQLFRRLAVFSGGSSLEAALRVCDGDAPVREEASLLARLAALVDKNLVTVEEQRDGEPRIRMLEMLREFGLERLLEADELADAQRRHAAYFLAFVERGEPPTGRSREDVAELEREHPNVRAALQWAVQSRSLELGLRLAGSLWRFWWMRGYYSEALTWLRNLLELAENATPPVPPAVRAKALHAQVVLLSGVGEFTAAREPCERAIALQRAAGDETGLSGSLTSLGIMLHFRGDAAGARAAHEESLANRRRLGRDLGVANSLANLSTVAYSLGEFEEAAALAEESALLRRRLGDDSGLAHSLLKLGLAKLGEREYQRAHELFSESLEIGRNLEYTTVIAYALANLGAVAYATGEPEAARLRYREALRILETLGSKSASAAICEEFAPVLCTLGEPLRAAHLLGAAEALRREIGSPRFPSDVARYEGTLAAVRAALGAEAFAAAWNEGASMTLERALAEASG